MIYALVDADGQVVNAIEWDGEAQYTQPTGLVAVPAPDGASPGWKWSKKKGFSPPPEPPPPPKSTVITALGFFGRFTPEERIAVQTATNLIPELGVGLINGLAAGAVDLLGETVIAWMDGLVRAGALTADRKTEILTP